MKTIVLEHTNYPGGWSDNKPYRVQKTVNSVDYNPGDTLSRDEVSGLCDNSAWRVEIKASS